MTLFRPCIDLHGGKVKQIVGGSLQDSGEGLQINFESERPAGFYANRYAEDGLVGGHVIKLGPNNDAAAREALIAYPRGLQIGGGITRENSLAWLEAGASHVIVTSWLFDDEGYFKPDRLDALVTEVGRDHVVIDLSCRASSDGWAVVMNRWQKLTDLKIGVETLLDLAHSCDEFLVHAIDVEGKCEGIDCDLIKFLGRHCPIPVTYAGGANAFENLQAVEELSDGRVDVTIGSALDLFGGNKVNYADCVEWNRWH